MNSDIKIAVVLREDLPVWKKLNVTAFTVSGIAGSTEEIIGEKYEDKSGNTYLPMITQPIVIYSANSEKIKKVHEKALRKGALFSIFTEDLFLSSTDEASREAVKACNSNELNIVGMAFQNEKRIIDKIVKGLSLQK
ncbi:hypothetical protein CN324_29670 [Bacillus anthracis]|uniref:DUF2000 family protein n=1 Tax=Bacillus cereus TaxID=1396 RepID=A0AAN5XIT6_BACCE|nr:MULTISPECIES: DUF2000 family protein [Bacillus]PED52307.1 hypothetical protein CON50_27305 [Bacillus anthracis]KAB2446144.1 DUF2000 family protein [Bacillus cereus]PDY57617.1 hypothetical protein COM87_19760 [Bacillus thuringiensis]PEF62679.1 hypothetical protein CON33_27975 [Bacillus anthracis]PEV21377.1 hypothetical protein CN420_23925 [Bacillus thuringiensis]